MWKWLNYQKQFFLFYVNYNNQHLYFEMNFNHLKLRYTDPFNFLTKRALVSQLNMLVVAKDPNISHYLNLSIHSPTIIPPLYNTHSTWLSFTNELKIDD